MHHNVKASSWGAQSLEVKLLEPIKRKTIWVPEQSALSGQEKILEFTRKLTSVSNLLSVTLYLFLL